MAKPRRPARRLARAMTLLGVLALGGALRFAPLPASRDAGHWVFTDGDSYYHLRRVEQTIQARGRVPMFDPELSYPEGQKLQWHGGYDLLVAGAVVAACGTTPTRPCLESVAILSTPLLGLAALLCLFALGRAIGGPRLGLLGAALFAVYPFAAGSAALGHVDHHVLEPLLVAAWLALLVRGRPVAAGLVAGLSLACFPTAPWPAAVTLAALLGLRVVEGAASRVRPLPFALALLAVAWPVAQTGAFAEAYEPSAVSRLHLVAFACAAAAALWVELALRAARLPRPRLGAALGVLFLGAAALVLLGPHLRPLLVFGRAAGLWSGVVQQAGLARSSGLGLLLAGLVLALGVATIRRGSADEGFPARRLLAAVAVPLSLAGLLQMRFLMVAAPGLVLLVADGLLALGPWLAARLAHEGPRARRLGRLAQGAAFALALVPALEYARWPFGPTPLLEADRLLRRLGVRPRDPGHPEAVLSDWTYGHHVLYLARRPTVASPFILSGDDPANTAARRALVSNDPESLYRFMHARRVRYLLVSELFDARSVARAMGWPAPRQAVGDLLRRGPHPRWPRLHLVDGEGAAEGLRLYDLDSSRPSAPKVN